MLRRLPEAQQHILRDIEGVVVLEAALPAPHHHRRPIDADKLSPSVVVPTLIAEDIQQRDPRRGGAVHREPPCPFLRIPPTVIPEAETGGKECVRRGHLGWEKAASHQIWESHREIPLLALPTAA